MQDSVFYCWQQHEGYALCHLPGIEVTAPPPPPPPDDCSSSPDPYESGLWCECYEYSYEPFWCAWDFEWQDWPVYESGGGSGGGETPQITVTCTPSSVVRGGGISCSATGDGVIQKWTFSGGGLPEVVRQTNDPNWSGTMVIGGTVTVEAIAGNETIQGSTSVTVTPRSLQVDKTSTMMGQGNLPAQPHQDDELGFADLGLPWMPQGWSATIGSGPNTGFAFVASSPFYADGKIYINQTALASGSAFMNAQTGGQYCTSSQLSNLGTLVLAHEQQHVDVYHTRVEARINSDVESLVKSGASGAQDLLQAVADAKNPIHNAAAAASDSVDITSPVQVPCTIKWSY